MQAVVFNNPIWTESSMDNKGQIMILDPSKVQIIRITE